MGNTQVKARRTRDQELHLDDLSRCMTAARQAAGELAARARTRRDQPQQLEIEQSTNGLRVGMTVYMRGLDFHLLGAGSSHNTPLRITELEPAYCTVVREDGGVGLRGLAQVRLPRTNLRLWPVGAALPPDEAGDMAICEVYTRCQALLQEGKALLLEAERQRQQAAENLHRQVSYIYRDAEAAASLADRAMGVERERRQQIIGQVRRRQEDQRSRARIVYSPSLPTDLPSWGVFCALTETARAEPYQRRIALERLAGTLLDRRLLEAGGLSRDS